MSGINRQKIIVTVSGSDQTPVLTAIGCFQYKIILTNNYPIDFVRKHDA